MPRILPLLLALTGTLPAAAQDAATYPKHFGADKRTVVVIPDLLPRLEALLKSPRFQRIMTESRFGRALKAMPGGFDPAALRTGLKEIAPYIPREIALGLSEAGLVDLARLLEACVVLDLFGAAAWSEDEAVLAQVPALRARLLELLRELRTPDLVLWVNLRGEAEAQSFAMLVGMQIRLLAAEHGLAVRSLPAGVDVTVTAKAVLGAGELRSAADVLAGEDAAEDQVDAFEAALKNITFSLRFERFGTGLRLALGTPGATDAPRLDPSAFGPLCSVDGDTWLVSHWEIGAVKEHARRFRTAMDALRGTPLGRHHAAMDETGLLDGMTELARAAESSGTSGTMRVRGGETLHVRIEEHDCPRAEDPAALARSLPPAEAYVLDGTETMGSLLAAFVLAVEDRLAMRSLREEFTDRPAWESAPAADLETAYYTHFTEFRRALYADFPAVFRGAAAVVMTRGRLERLSVQRRGAAPAVKAGAVIPEVALLGRVDDAEAALAAFGAVWSGFGAGFASATGREEAAGAPPLLEADLGLKAPTRLVNGAWIRTLMAAQGLRVDLEGDFAPHVFVQGDLFVLSTSPRLSRAVLAAHRGEGGRLALPEAEGRLVSCGRLPGTAFSAMVEPLMDIFALMLQGEGGAAGQLLQHMNTLKEFAAGLFEILDRAEWTVTDARDLRTTEFQAHFIE